MRPRIGGGRGAYRTAPALLLYGGLVVATAAIGAAVGGSDDESDPGPDSAASGAVATTPVGSTFPAPASTADPSAAPPVESEVDGQGLNEGDVEGEGDTEVTRTPGPIDAPRERIGGFRQSSHDLHPIEDGLWPYQDGVVRPVPFGRVDEQGVRMFRLDDDPTIWNHSIAQAQYALRALESYRLTGEQQYLDVAIANAERIVEGAFEIDGAWYFPYEFTFDLHRSGRGVLEGPWSSGMASGQALSLFTRLYAVTGEQVWRDHADRAFRAFLQAPDGQGFFSSWVDDEGQLWLEEYGRYPVELSERVLNGHMWSMFGLWDYWRMNDHDQDDAEELWRGALYTVEQTAMSEFRQPGRPSLYSLWQRMPAFTYHQHHQRQFLVLYQMTHDPAWVARAFAYRDDYPEWRDYQEWSDAEGFVVITPEVTELYRLDDSAHHVSERTMAIEETRAVSFTSVTGARFDRRGRMADGRNAIRLSSGPHAGWWVPEEHGRAWSRDPVERHDYHPPVELTADEPVRLTAVSYDGEGNRAGERPVELGPGRSSPAVASAIVEGRPAWLLSGPGLEGYWLPHQPDVTIVGAPADEF